MCVGARVHLSIMGPMDPMRFLLICLAGWMNRNQQQVIEYLGDP